MECSSTFSPIIARLANLSFTEGVFPSAFKCAQLTPIVKKAELDPSVLTNYRPISNLSNINKILERLYFRFVQIETSSLTPLFTTSICLPITPFNRDSTHPHCQRHVWGCRCRLCNRTCSTRPISSVWYHRSRRSSKHTFGYCQCYWNSLKLNQIVFNC